MRTKFVRVRSMDEIEDVRRAAAALIDREQYRVRSRMVAYENIGSLIGASGSWLRRFVNQYPEVTLSYPVGLNIKAIYARVCARVEHDNDQRRQRIKLIEEASDAARAGTLDEFDTADQGMASDASLPKDISRSPGGAPEE